MPSIARQIEMLPPAPSEADLRECASRRPPITYQQLLAERAGGGTIGANRETNAGIRAPNRPKRGTKPVSLGTLPFDEPAPIGPVKIVLPWSSLLADNRKYASNDDSVWTTKEYRAAKAKAVESITQQLPDGWTPIAVPVAFRLVFIEPNRQRRRDILNYQKLVCDALKGLVYVDDSLIDDHHWTRGIPDIDRPRAEITVQAIAP
jgi:Holliday junction resolvase RusA-like endonuclease